MDTDKNHKSRRQLLYWRLFGKLFGAEEAVNLEQTSAAILADIDLPTILLDPGVSVDNVIQRYPKLKTRFAELMQHIDDAETSATDLQERDELERAAIYSKLLMNVFGNARSGLVSANQYGDWCRDVEWLERCFGATPGELRGRRGGAKAGAGIDDEALAQGLQEMEGDMIARMKLREVLGNDVLAQKLAPSMSLVKQLLRDKSNLSGTALRNAKRLIKKYVDEVAEILKTQVSDAKVGSIDYSVPPKKVFQNLDLKRTIWKNLVNWDPESRRLYVDQLFYRHTAHLDSPSRLIIVVDQSGSMVDSMVNCTILASIFAGLPKVDAHLIAYDTQAIDLSAWVHDPFQVLLRTNLGGGNDGPVAMQMAQTKISDPRNTCMVWISDFYEFDRSQPLFDMIKAVKESGVCFIPVGSVKSSGQQMVNPWFKTRLKQLGCPVISGSMKKLIVELKTFLN